MRSKMRMARHTRPAGALSVTVLAAVAVTAGCGGGATKERTAAPAAPARVNVVTVAPVDWQDTYEASGTVRARTAATLSSKVMGYVREVRVETGARVREGQLLVSLEARDLESNLRRAEAGLTEAHAAQPEVENAIRAAQSNLDLARVTFRRMQELYQKKSISNQEYDETSARLKAAEAAYAMAVAKRPQLQARIAQAEQEREAAGITRAYAEIRAPFGGVVTAKSVDPGMLATPGAPLLTLEREGAWRLEAGVDESKLDSIRLGGPVRVVLDSFGRTLDARVSEVVPAVDAGSRTYTVKIDLPPSPQLRSGLFGRALFPAPKRQVLALPAEAVQERGQLQSVMVDDHGTARTRLITAGRKSGDRVEVLSGLTAGEKVIVPAPAALADGAPVEARL